MRTTRPALRNRRVAQVFALALALGTLASASSASAAPLFATDGGFESPVVSGVSDLSDGQVFGGWHAVGSVDLVGGFWQNTEGSQSVDLNGGGPGAIYQDVPTIPGHSYTLAFDYAGNPDAQCTPGLKQMQVKWNGQVQNTETIDTTSHDFTDMGWIHRSYGGLPASTGVTTRVEFDSYQTDGACGPTLDAVSIVDNGPASAAPACASAGNCNWSLASDVYQNMAGVPSNPLPDSLGDKNVWSYRAAGDYVGALQSNFSPAWFGAPNVPAFYGEEGGFPFVAMNTTSSPITFNGASATAPSHEVIVHPSPDSPVIVEWTSPIDGTLALTGGVIDTDPSDAGAQTTPDGVGWKIMLNGDIAIAHGSIPTAGSQTFANGTVDGARQLSGVQVSRGDTLDFIVTADQNGATSGSYWGDTTQLDVNLQQGAGSTLAKPVVQGGGVIVKSSTDATIQTSINPEGHATTWRVEYASTASGPWTAVPSPTPLDANSDPSQTTPQTVTLRIPCPVGSTGCTAALQPGHTYYYRVVAINAGGTTTTDPPGQFDTTAATPPDVHTTAPCINANCPGGPDVELDSINMHGTVNPHFVPATWQFQVTPCPNFDYTSCPSNLRWTKAFPATPQPLPADGVLHLVTKQATGLTPGTTYYWRLVASNTLAPTPWQQINASIQHAAPGDDAPPTFSVTATNLVGSGTANLGSGLLPALDYGTQAIIAYTCTDPVGANGSRPSGLAKCEATDNGQPVPSGSGAPLYGDITVTRARSALPTTTPGSHTLQLTATDVAHHTTTHTWTYTVKAKPTPAQQTKAAQQTQNQVVKQWTPGLWDQWFMPRQTHCVVSADCGSSSNPGITVWQNGAVTTSPSGTIIAAGAGNLYNKNASAPLLQGIPHLYEALDSQNRIYAVIGAGGGNIIGAGAGNIIAAGGGNITPNVAVVGIIAAGGGNIVSAGGGNIISAGGGNIISAGGGNIIAAGGGNIIAAGGGNVIGAGGGNVIGAGGGNFSAALMFALNGSGSAFYNNFDATKFAPPTSLNQNQLAQTITGSAGDTLITQVLTTGGTGLSADVAKSAGSRFASGRVTFLRTGQPTILTLTVTSSGARLIKQLITLNRTLRKKHRRPHSIRLVIADTFKPLGGKAITKRSSVRITPH